MTAPPREYVRTADRPPDESTWSAFFAGDCVDGRASDGGQPIEESVVERVAAVDLAAVNLEAPVPTDAEAIEKVGPTKQAIEGTPAMLRAAGFNVVALANNHSMDYGERGLIRTIEACHRNSMLTCGAGEDVDDAMAPIYLTIAGTSIALFAFCEREFGIAEGDGAGTAWISHPSALDRVAEEAARSDAVLVVAHGGIEYVPFPSPTRQGQLRAFVDAGADLVVGHHPHVPQGWEIHDGTPIFYSLGNFRFHQPRRPATQWGLGLSVEFAGSTPIAVELVPTVLSGGTVRELGREDDRRERLRHLHRLSRLTADRETLRAHWQAVATRVYDQRYTRWLREGTGGGLAQSLLRLLRAVGVGENRSRRRRRERLVLLNLLRNESHRDVIQTALEVRTGETEDRRTPEVREAVEVLLSRTDDRPHSNASVESTLRKLRRRAGAVVPGVD